MTHTYTESVQIIEAALARSSALLDIGLATCMRERVFRDGEESTDYRFSLVTGLGRKLDIDYCYSPILDNNFFLIEVFNIVTNDSFLLDRWIDQHPNCSSPYPFTLSVYSGSLFERACSFVSFLERPLKSAELSNILQGRNWEHLRFEEDERQ